MDNVLSRFAKIKTVFLDIDGVLTDGTVWAFRTGEQVRRFNIKDGWAINRAVKTNLPIVIISAGHEEGVRVRLEYLGLEHIHIGVANKLELFQEYIDKWNLAKDEILYMGDDMPDYEAFQLAGLKCCPADSSADILEICDYISPKNGGQGAVRDVLEKILKLQGKWPKLRK